MLALVPALFPQAGAAPPLPSRPSCHGQLRNASVHVGDKNLPNSEVSGYQPVSRIGEIVINSFVDA